MKVSLEWLKSLVEIDCSVDELVEKLTMSGTKVEGYEKRLDSVKNVVVGKILDVFCIQRILICLFARLM